MTVLTTFPPLVLEGYLPPKELGGNPGRRHWGTRTKIKNATLTEWKIIGQSTHWPPQVMGGLRRRLTITMRRPRRLDKDNSYTAVKYLVDGLRLSGVLLGDSERHLDLVVLQEVGPPRTVVTLEELER